MVMRGQWRMMSRWIALQGLVGRPGQQVVWTQGGAVFEQDGQR